MDIGDSGLGIGDWRLGLGIGLGDWAWELGLGIGIGDWDWGLELGIEMGHSGPRRGLRGTLAYLVLKLHLMHFFGV